jgi:dihydrodipicolinate synthase/N-acetylneuraminate lyase
MTKIRGMLLPLPTVFREDGSVDEAVMRDMVNYYVDAGVHAFFVCGSYGQGAAMSLDERKRVAEIVLEECRDRVPSIVHIGTADPYTTLELGRHALSRSAYGVGMVGPYYYSDHKRDEVRAHYRMIGQELQVPILIYDNPGYSGYPIGPELMAQMVADSPQIFGSKVSNANIDTAIMYRDALPPGFALFVGASSLFPGLLVGIAGTVSPPLTLCPEIGVAVVDAVDRGDNDRAMKLGVEVIEFHGLITRMWKQAGYGAFGTALREVGFRVQKYPRWPAADLSDELTEELRRALARVREAVGAREPQRA